MAKYAQFYLSNMACIQASLCLTHILYTVFLCLPLRFLVEEEVEGAVAPACILADSGCCLFCSYQSPVMVMCVLLSFRVVIFVVVRHIRIAQLFLKRIKTSSLADLIGCKSALAGSHKLLVDLRHLQRLVQLLR